MNKIFKLFMLAVVVLGFSSCYNEFEEPAPAKVWTKEDFSNSKLISIKDFSADDIVFCDFQSFSQTGCTVSVFFIEKLLKVLDGD